MQIVNFSDSLSLLHVSLSSPRRARAHAIRDINQTNPNQTNLIKPNPPLLPSS